MNNLMLSLPSYTAIFKKKSRYILIHQEKYIREILAMTCPQNQRSLLLFQWTLESTRICSLLKQRKLTQSNIAERSVSCIFCVRTRPDITFAKVGAVRFDASRSTLESPTDGYFATLLEACTKDPFIVRATASRWPLMLTLILEDVPGL